MSKLRVRVGTELEWHGCPSSLTSQGNGSNDANPEFQRGQGLGLKLAFPHLEFPKCGSGQSDSLVGDFRREKQWKNPLLEKVQYYEDCQRRIEFESRHYPTSFSVLVKTQLPFHLVVELDFRILAMIDPPN
ncbi:hypothetical protein RIF29_29726 [Crotalaria pallida]|uniref:Uncharacterized protein n=1 Tax=Crotalaria pallida TaxID=3830 RepID=A0AAN9HXQ0_CROPI